MPRTIEEIESDINAIKSRSDWATREGALNAIAALINEKNLLQPSPAGKYWFPMKHDVLRKNELILSLCFLRRSSLINEIVVHTDTFISSHFFYIGSASQGSSLPSAGNSLLFVQLFVDNSEIFLFVLFSDLENGLNKKIGTFRRDIN